MRRHLGPKAPERAEVRLAAMDMPSLARVMEVEQRAYAHPWSRANFNDVLQSGYHARLLLGGDTLVGYFVVMPGVQEAHLLNITVDPNYQRQGWGRLMLDAARLWAVSETARILWLEVRVGNARAIQVYQSHGFELVGQRKAYYAAGRGKREDALVMRLQLG
jgi:ribosomal-protein-alanine N-acetyltransferase